MPQPLEVILKSCPNLDTGEADNRSKEMAPTSLQGLQRADDVLETAPALILIVAP